MKNQEIKWHIDSNLLPSEEQELLEGKSCLIHTGRGGMFYNKGHKKAVKIADEVPFDNIYVYYSLDEYIDGTIEGELWFVYCCVISRKLRFFTPHNL